MNMTTGISQRSVRSLAGIPGLIASQVQEAFTADRQDPAHTRVCAWRPLDPADPG